MNQFKRYKQISTNLSYNELAIHCDSSEHYLCKHITQIQAAHFGTSQKQITFNNLIGNLHKSINDLEKIYEVRYDEYEGSL